MSVRANEVKCNNLTLLQDENIPNERPQVDLSIAVVKLTNIYEEEINFILNHNTTPFHFDSLNASADFVVTEGAICHWDDREQNCTLRRLINAQQLGLATPHWVFALGDETPQPTIDLFMYVEYHATIKLAPKTNDPWSFNILLESSNLGTFADETWIAQEYTKSFSGTGDQTRDISWIVPQVIPKPSSQGPYFRLIMRQTAGGVGNTNGVDVTVESMFLRVSVKPYVRSIKIF
jgi:hypothetical protein